ncbi:MAG: Flp family type IVb pilin [Candidatus Binatia bacterium]
MANVLVRFMREDDGQDLVEYAFLIVFIALVAAVGLDLLGVNLLNFYNAIAAGVAAPPPIVPTPGP